EEPDAGEGQILSVRQSRLAADAAGEQQQNSNHTAENDAPEEGKEDAVEDQHRTQHHRPFKIPHDQWHAIRAVNEVGQLVEDEKDDKADDGTNKRKPQAVLIAGNEVAANNCQDGGRISDDVVDQFVLQIGDDDQDEDGDVDAVEDEVNEH